MPNQCPPAPSLASGSTFLFLFVIALLGVGVPVAVYYLHQYWERRKEAARLKEVDEELRRVSMELIDRVRRDSLIRRKNSRKGSSSGGEEGEEEEGLLGNMDSYPENDLEGN
jgi:hypothetical protein